MGVRALAEDGRGAVSLELDRKISVYVAADRLFWPLAGRVQHCSVRAAITG